jgi:hypothetical protein
LELTSVAQIQTSKLTFILQVIYADLAANILGRSALTLVRQRVGYFSEMISTGKHAR